MKSGNESLDICIAVLSAWLGSMLILFALIRHDTLALGDFGFPSAMAYHGIMVPSWLMLALACFRRIEHSDSLGKLLAFAAISATVLTGVGSALVHGKGLSLPMILQITGMIIGELVVLVIVLKSAPYLLGTTQDNVELAASWAVLIGLLGTSLATPLGHLAGAIEDLSVTYPLFLKHAQVLGLAPSQAVEGYVASHSHQMLAAFLATAFALPLVRRSTRSPSILNLPVRSGLYLMATATIAQITLYQYSAWFGWDPPDLLSKGPNGLPLDDSVLLLLGFGMLLLLPSLSAGTEEASSKDYARRLDRTLAFLLLCYLISVVGLGLYIEFHEQYFGHAEGSAPGVRNDLAYIRAHLLFGFMVIPLLLGVLLNAEMIRTRSHYLVASGFSLLIAVTGLMGTFVWTFLLESLILKITLALTAAFLLTFAAQYAIAAGHWRFDRGS